LALLIFVDFFQQRMLEEYLRVIREVSAAKPCNPTALVGSIMGIIPLQLPWRDVLCGLVVFDCVMLLVFPGWKYPRTDISGEET